MQKQSFSPLSILWVCNIILLLTYVVSWPSLSFLKSSVLEYKNVASDPFDGAVSPIAYVPDWSKGENINKARAFESFSISDFIDIPEYDSELLADSLQKNTAATILRYTYPVVYMGSYRGNYTEFDGSHPAVDIRAPIGTPVVSVANGVVIKVKDNESGDGKYVIIRHDNVNLDGEIETLYSGYEHLSEIFAVEWTKIKRWEVLGKVGITGITTTPHLHFQIDKSTSPFHLYWPYSFKEAANLGLDFFGAINVGLGKENAIRYTIHPMDFIKNHRFLGAAPAEQSLVLKEESKPFVTSSETVADARPPINDSIETVVPMIENIPMPEPQKEPEIIQQPVVISEGEIIKIEEPKPMPPEKIIVPVKSTPIFVPDSIHIFSDISPSSSFYTATKYLWDAWIAHGYDDGWFHPNDLISRSETILLYDRLFSLVRASSDINLPFLDILPSDELYMPLLRAYSQNIVIKAKYFRSNDSLTRAEAITLLIRTSEIPLSTSTASLFKDVKTSNTHMIYINTFARYLGIKGGNFEPSKNITRGELAKILYTFNTKTDK